MQSKQAGPSLPFSTYITARCAMTGCSCRHTGAKNSNLYMIMQPVSFLPWCQWAMYLHASSMGLAIRSSYFRYSHCSFLFLSTQKLRQHGHTWEAVLCQQLGIGQPPRYADLEARQLKADKWQQCPAIARGIMWLQLQQAIIKAEKQGWQHDCTTEEQWPPEPLLAVMRDKTVGFDKYLESCVNEDFASGAAS